MFEILDRRANLTGNQIKILTAAIIGDALEFFDYFLIGFVLAFLIGPWKLTFGQSAVVLMSSGIGAIMGAYVWGWLADRIGRRKVFIGTVLNFSIATGLLYFTPDNGWIYLSIMRFFVGVGVGGLYCVDLPLVQEFMPSSKRGWVGGIVTCVIPLGVGLGAVMGAFMGSDQWRLLFAIGVMPALFVLLLKVTPQEASKMMILLTVSGFIGRLSFSYFSEALGRRTAGGLLGIGAGVMTIIAGYNYDATLFGLSAFWLLLAITFF